MIIYRTQDNNGTATTISVAEVPVTAKAVHKATLMKEDFVKLVFESDVDYKFKAGDWVELEAGGMPYILADDYFPSMKDEATFSYELQFNAPWYNLYKTIFLFNTYKDGVIVKRESDWYITDTAQNILSLIIRTTQDADRGCSCVFNDVLDCEPTVVKTFTFSSTSILSALNNLAKEFELEWWVTYEGGEYYLHFGECDNSITRDANGAVTFDGSTNVRVRNSALAVELTSGENVTKPSVSQKDGLKKKYYVFGSSRNIDQNAVQDMEAGFVTSIVTKRLELAGNPQVMPEGSGEEVVVFDDIYPRSDYQISGVTPVEIITDEAIAYDEQGNPSEYKRYNVYNLQIEGFSDYIFSLIQNDPNVQNVEDIIASGKPLSLKFITKEMGGQTHTPLLAGFEFELSATLVTDENTGNSWYEFQIQHQDLNGYIIPNDNLIPQTGDWVCIFNVKGKYIGGTGSNDGQADLRAAFNKWYANKKRDVSYTIKPYANEDIDLNIGDAVVLNYKDNSVTSRVFSYEKALDLILAGLGCSDASYTISSYAKTGSVNQLKEDVKVLTASIANGTAGGNMDASAVQNAIATYGRRLFLSKTTEDKADGHITFKEGITSKKNANLEGGATFGTFESGFLGSGAMIDQYGNAEVKSLYAREFISTPEFRFNRITVTEGEQWNTNAFGIIEDVRVINGKNCIVLHLEDGDSPSVKYGDLCRGIYNNIGYENENGKDGYGTILINDQPYDIDDQPELDDCNFPTKNGFFTSYFMATDDPNYYTDEDGKKHWYFPFITKSQQSGSDSTPLPCKNMKFAQYGNPYNQDRQSSFYQTSIRHSYIQQLEHVDSWEIHPWNIASRYGYLGDLTVTLKNADGSTYNTTLQGNGLYVQDNVYFGNATIQLDPVTIEDIKNQLANYSIQLSAYTDVIKVDDAGNVIDGLWKDTGEAPNISRQYRIFSVITARNGITPLTIEENDVPCGKGKFKVYLQPYGCSCKLENSTLFITHIDNVKDGVAGTDDDVNFDYDACRAMERVWVDLRVECEGEGSILATMPITIKHDPVPYIMADLTNENAGISWSTENNDFIGLPLVTYINMAKGNLNLPIERIEVNSINEFEPIWNAPHWSNVEQAYVYEDIDKYSPTFGWKLKINPQCGEEGRELSAKVVVDNVPSNAEPVTELLLTCQTTYAGVTYERTLSLHITRTTDMAIWDVVPNHHSVNVDRNAYFNFAYVGVQIYSTDKNGRNEVSNLPTGYHLDYRISRVLPTYSAVTSPTGNPAENGWYELSNGDYVLTSDTTVQSKTYYSAGAPYSTSVGNYITLNDTSAQVRVNDPSYAETIKSIEFTLFDDKENILDSEEVQVIREGLGGQGSTGPAGNGVQQVTDYYLRAKDGFTPTNDLTATPSSSQVEVTQNNPSGWIPNVFTAPSKDWPNVWHFTKYDYTSSPDYDTTPSLITTYSEDGNNIVGIHTYYLRTNEDNVNNIRRDDQGGTGWLVDTFVEPDNSNENGHGRFVWRYFVFQYSKEVNGSYYMYSPIEFVAKFVEDGTSFQCAYKVFPTQVNGSDYTPVLDAVSTGADMPKTNNSSWSGSTNGLVVGDGYALWMTQRTYKGATYNNWGDPVRISGFKGETGADGTDIEFIYKLSNDGNPTAAEKPTYDYDEVNDTYWQATIDGVVYKFDSNDFNPSNVPNATGSNLGWTDNPSGVDKNHKYEWVCQRTKKKGEQHWGGWVGPFVWSAYGDTGMDGDGVEYVYIRQENKPATPHSPAFKFIGGSTSWNGKVYEESEGNWRPEGWTGANFLSWLNGGFNEQGEWVPHTNEQINGVTVNEQWADNPLGVSGENPVEWVSVRKRINGKWHGFSEPAVWATYSEKPDIRIVGGYWWSGNDYLRDENGNPVKAEGADGTGVKIKGHVDYWCDDDIPQGETGKTTLEQKTVGASVGDCWLVEENRYLYVFNGTVSDDWYDKWTSLGEFKGVKGDSVFMHIAWATGMLFENGEKVHPVVVKNGVTQQNWFDVEQQEGVEYEWMGIYTTDSQENPNGADPHENADWDLYAWNHIKGKDGADYERVYYRSEVNVKPSVVCDANIPDTNGKYPKDDEYLPAAGNHQSCNPQTYQTLSSQFTDDPVGVSEDYPYEWVAERKKVDGVWQAFSDASLWANFAKDGEGVTRVDTYYLKTTMSVGVTYSTQGWVANTYQTPDADKPYVWRYSASYVGVNMVGRTACELIAVYNSAPNVNLLDDTAFSSDAAMEAWVQKGHVSGDPTADPSNANYNSQLFDNFFGVTTGTQGFNAYYGRFKGTGASGSYIIMLEQNIIDERVNKVELGKWYTLSYWVKGAASSRLIVNIFGQKYVNGSPQARELVDRTTGIYVNGKLVANAHGQQFTCAVGGNEWNKFSTEWTKHTITFKTVDSIDADRCFVHWQMTDTTSVHEVYICMPKLEIGMVATTYSNGQTSTKAFPRTGEWEKDKQYFAGNFGEPYLDAVHSGVNNFGYPAFYRCIRTHISSDENSPTSANGRLYWDAGSWDGFLATGLFLAQYAFIENLGVGILRTGEPNDPHVEMFDSIARFFGTGGHKSIELATDEDGVGVLRFYDKAGNAMYDLGPNGIMENFSSVPTTYTSVYYKPITTGSYITELVVVGEAFVTELGNNGNGVNRYYHIKEGYKAIRDNNNSSILVATYHISHDRVPSAWDGAVVNNNNYGEGEQNSLVGTNPATSTQKITNGWYSSVHIGIADKTGEDMSYVEIHHFVNGKITTTKKVYYKDAELIADAGNGIWYDEAGNRHYHESLNSIMNDN